MSTSLDQVDLMINHYYGTMTDPNELAFTNTGKDDESRARTVWLSINANEQNAAEKAVFEAVEKKHWVQAARLQSGILDRIRTRLQARRLVALGHLGQVRCDAQ